MLGCWSPDIDQLDRLGAEILRGRSVTGLTQDDSSVTVELADGTMFTGQYAVGADGAGSIVRRAARIGFPGTDATVFGYLGDVMLDDPPPVGFRVHNEHGALMTAPIPGGFVRVSGYDAADQEPGRRTVTMDELRATAVRIAGTDFGMQYLHAGRAIVLNMSGTPLTAPSEYRIGTLADATAAIVRPDGHVWWATDESDVDTVTRTALAELGTTF
jgi:FAD binding domain-containing protein